MIEVGTYNLYKMKLLYLDKGMHSFLVTSTFLTKAFLLKTKFFAQRSFIVYFNEHTDIATAKALMPADQTNFKLYGLLCDKYFVDMSGSGQKNFFDSFSKNMEFFTCFVMYYTIYYYYYTLSIIALKTNH
jgi:hypothetical protein